MVIRGSVMEFSKQQKISYQLFFQEQRNRLQLKYPFLSKSQINGKVKDLWNNLDLKEKQTYSKTVLVKVSPKSQACETKQRKDKQSGDPDHRRWGQFSTPEGLFCDFEALLSPKENLEPKKKSRADRCTESITKCNNWLGENPENSLRQSMTKSNEKSQLNVKETMDEQKETDCCGILKENKQSKFTSSKTKAKRRVSFNPLEQNKSDESSEEEGNESAAEVIQVVVQVEDNSQDYSDEEYDAKLLHRSDLSESYNFDEIEKHDLQMEEIDVYPTGNHQVNAVCKPKLKLSQRGEGNREGREILTGSENSSRAREEYKNTKRIEEKSQLKSCRKNTIKASERETVEENDDTHTADNFVNPVHTVRTTRSMSKQMNSLISKEKVASTPMSLTTPVLKCTSRVDQYTTPQMDESMTRQNLDQVSKAPVKRRSLEANNNGHSISETNIKLHKKVRTSLLEMSLPSQMENLESSILVDASGDAKEKDQEVSRQKLRKTNTGRQHSGSSPRMDADSLIERETENVDNREDAQQKKKKTIVRRRSHSSPRMDADSLIEGETESTDSEEDSTEETEMLGGKRRRSLTKFKSKIRTESLTDKEKDNELSETKNGRHGVKRLRNFKRREDDTLGDPTQLKGAKTLDSTKIMEVAVEREENNSTESDIDNNCLYEMNTADDASLCSTTSDGSVTIRPVVNKALVKCLEGMQRTVQYSGSPQYSESPDLLASPSLSGISQLSDLSANSSECNHSDIMPDGECIDKSKIQSHKVLEKPKKVPQTEKPEESGLCEMFHDIAPSQIAKAKGTRRIATSSRDSGKSNFSSLFQEADIFI